MAEWLKAVDCKSIEFSRRRFESYSLLRNIAQLEARLFWEQEVMCSNHIISKNFHLSAVIRNERKFLTNLKWRRQKTIH